MLLNNKYFLRFVFSGWLLLFVGVAHATIQLEKTRVIYNSNQKEASVRVMNVAQYPVLAQSWIDLSQNQSKIEGGLVPFFVTPPLARIDANKAQVLRIIYTGEALPEDRETMYWVNIQEIPPKGDESGQNSLQISVLTKLKLFFRPTTLKGSSEDAVKETTWEIVDDHGQMFLRATNPSPYYLNLATVSVKEKSIEHTVKSESIEAVPPKGTLSFILPNKGFLPSKSPNVTFSYVTDYGNVLEVNSLKEKKQ